MALARFFDRTFAAAGRALRVSREALEAALTNHVVAVYCGGSCAQEGNPRWIVELLVNLLARLYPRLAIEAEPALREHLEGIARSINPSISLEKGEGAAVAVAVEMAESPQPEALHARADGWVARLLLHPPKLSPGPANPYSAAAAATLAAAEVFRRLFRERLSVQQEPREVNLSLLDFGDSSGAEEPLGPVDLGQVAFMGLGAVGNGALWALGRHASLTGELWLVDHEDLELSNLQRYVLGTDADVGNAKVDLAGAALRQPGLKRHLRKEKLEDFADRYRDGFVLPTVCVSVDNVQGRRAVQALLPRLVLNGWTSDSGLGASWHEFDRDSACLSCLYQPMGQRPSETDLVADALGLDRMRAAHLWIRDDRPTPEDLAKMREHLGLKPNELEAWRGKRLREVYTGLICGSVRLDVQGVGRMEAVPLAHQSVLAGVFMAAELVKRCTPALASRSQQQGLIVWEDVLRRPPSTWRQNRPRAPGCICGDTVYQEVFRKKWRSSATPAPKEDAPAPL
jgi:hypothetical protein